MVVWSLWLWSSPLSPLDDAGGGMVVASSTVVGGGTTVHGRGRRHRHHWMTLVVRWWLRRRQWGGGEWSLSLSLSSVDSGGGSKMDREQGTQRNFLTCVCACVCVYDYISMLTTNIS